LIRSSFWLENKGFDSQFVPAYCEDCDLSLSAWSQGKEVLYDPFSLVYHHESGSHGEAAAGLIHENTKKLAKKWKRDLLWHWENNGEVRNEHLRDSKGIVVLIDYRLPSLLKDSGSIRTIRLARLLKKSRYHVVLAALDRMTTLADINDLRREGIEVHLDLNGMYESLVGRENRISCFWLIREYVFNRVIDDLRRISPGTFIINDLLDLNYSISKGEVRIQKDQVKALESADLTVLVSPHESRILSSYNSNLKVLDIWKPFSAMPSSIDFTKRKNVLFVGGFRHLPNVEGIFWFVDEVLPEIKDSLGLSVQVVGTGLSKSQSAYLIEAGVEVLGGVEDLTSFYEDARVAIVPLQSGAGMKGKLAEALSYGVPVVTTKVGAEGYDFQAADMIEIHDSPKDFGLSVIKLGTDRDSFINASNAALDYIRRKHSEDAITNKLELVLQEIWATTK
jgi:glycosyltransferase involved in cell wall biosynthesis